MKILGLDTTRKSAIVVLILDDKKIIKVLSEDEKHSENLMNRIDELFMENDVELKDIDSFAVVSGPGSFTGIRVGMAIVKAFSYALNKPIIELKTFDIIKNSINNGTFLSECTTATCYFAEIKNNKIVEVGIIDKDDLSSENDYFILKEEHLLLNSAYKYNVLKNYSDLFVNQVIELYNKNCFSKSPEPYYLQLSQAERNLEKANDKKSN